MNAGISNAKFDLSLENLSRTNLSSPFRIEASSFAIQIPSTKSTRVLHLPYQEVTKINSKGAATPLLSNSPTIISTVGTVLSYDFTQGNIYRVKNFAIFKMFSSSILDSLVRSKPKPTMKPTPTTISPTKNISPIVTFTPANNPTVRSTDMSSFNPSYLNPTFRPTTRISASPTKSNSPTKKITQVPTSQNTQVYSWNPTFQTTQSFKDIAYHPPQPVMTGTVNAYHIFYGDFSSANATMTKNLVNYFADHLGGSPWYRILSSYYQIVSGVKTFVSDSFVFKKSVNVAATTSILSTMDVINTILALFNSGTFAVDTNAIYTLFFRGDIAATFDPTKIDSLSWLSHWCGYHGAFYLKLNSNTQVIIKFIVVGDPSFAGQSGRDCEEYVDKPTSNKNMGGDSMVNVYAHELAGTVTNYLNAWFFDSNFDENGDECFWNFGNYSGNSNIKVGSKDFLVQKMWLPGKGCVLSN